MPVFSDTLPTATQQEKDAVLAQIKMLDPGQEGVKVHRLRAFYPKLGWNVIYQRLYALTDDGKLNRSLVGSPPVEVYTWK